MEDENWEAGESFARRAWLVDAPVDAAPSVFPRYDSVPAPTLLSRIFDRAAAFELEKGFFRVRSQFFPLNHQLALLRM